LLKSICQGRRAAYLSGISTSEDRRRIARGEAVGQLGIETPIVCRSLTVSLSRSADQLRLRRLSSESRAFDTLVVHGSSLVRTYGWRDENVGPWIGGLAAMRCETFGLPVSSNAGSHPAAIDLPL
jgi:hypothetical protein